jgi:predicted  nucleic acid-binding Zn-ribbon protein
MSDTPRTESEVNRQKCWSDDLVTIDANFACQLERELNAANAEIEEKRKDVVWLATEKAKLENYVMRLEEAGDALEYASVILEAGEDPNGFEKLLIAQRAWRKAKEAKP